MKRYTIEPGTTPDEKERGVWVKLTYGETIAIRSRLYPTARAIDKRIDAKIAEAQRGAGWL